MRLISAVVAWAALIGNAAAVDCASGVDAILDLGGTCKSSGFRISEPGKECDAQSWSQAKANIDWVMFDDRGAEQTYKQSLACFNVAADDSLETRRHSFKAVLMAQSHSLSAQCAIERCKWNYLGYRGYFAKLREANALPGNDLTSHQRRTQLMSLLQRDARKAAADAKEHAEFERDLEEFMRESDSRGDEDGGEERKRSGEGSSTTSSDEFIPEYIQEFGGTPSGRAPATKKSCDTSSARARGASGPLSCSAF